MNILGNRDLAALRAAVEKMTPGPWRWQNPRGGVCSLVTVGRGMLLVLDAARSGLNRATLRFAMRSSKDEGGLMWKADQFNLAEHPDAAGIVALRNSALPLIAELERGRARIANLEVALRPFADCVSVAVNAVDGTALTDSDDVVICYDHLEDSDYINARAVLEQP